MIIPLRNDEQQLFNKYGVGKDMPPRIDSLTEPEIENRRQSNDCIASRGNLG